MPPRIVTKARQLRLERQAKLGRMVTLQEVAEATKIERAALNRIELGKTKGIDFETLVKLCNFYGVGVGQILEYADDIRASSLSPTAMSPAGTG